MKASLVLCMTIYNKINSFDSISKKFFNQEGYEACSTLISSSLMCDWCIWFEIGGYWLNLEINHMKVEEDPYFDF